MQEQSSRSPNDTVGADSGHPGDTNKKPAMASAGNVLVVVVLLVALGVGTYALFRIDSWGGSPAGGPERFQLDLAGQMEIPEELLAYTRKRTLDTSLSSPVAVDVGPNGTIYVAGDRALEVFSPDGSSCVIELESQPSCLAVDRSDDPEAGGIYIGADQGLLVLNRVGELVRQWTVGDARSVLTSIAVEGEDVFVADAGRRVVMHFDVTGRLLNTIGQVDADRQMPGFVVPSRCFDLAIGPDKVLHIVNPGMRRVEAYDFRGELQSFWGRGGPALPDFFGCCNPARLALIKDGRFVTSEKGLPRIKIYSPVGDFQHVVAGPDQLGVAVAALGDARGNQSERIFDIAVDDAGYVIVLDPHNRQVIVFEPLKTEADS